MMAGNAARMAAFHAKRELFKILSKKLEANPDDLVIRNSKIFIKGSPKKAIDFDKAVKIALREKGGLPISGKGVYNPKSKDPLFVSPTFSFGAQTAGVEVDYETGEVKVKRILVAHDAGTIINPLSVEGQLQGSIGMGLGYALSEYIQRENGQILNPSLLSYKIPTSLEMPDIGIINIETFDPEGPFGAKEAGEGIVSPTAPAIANAIHELADVVIKDIPITPEKILKELEKNEKN
jgi:4-hydroxybenzoyl-CoA reductase subunit alpha